MMWLIAILIFLAAFFNACMDVFENTPNFNESIFNNWDKKYWCKDVSWQHAKKIFGYKFDSWHISKSLMWGCVITAVIIGMYVPPPRIHWGIHFVSLVFCWNATFKFFYHHVFKVK